jgi:AAA ATPase domain
VGVFEQRGEAELKGFGSPVGIFEVVSSIGRLEMTPRAVSPAQLPSALDLETPLVGRDRELAWLRGTWRAARRGRGRVVFVSGPPGIGKTSLAAVLAGHVAAQGYAVRYAGAGGLAAARVGEAVADAASARSPMLVVLDDLGVTGELAGEALGEAFDAIESGPVLVVGLSESTESVAALGPVVQRAEARGDGHRQLVPLTTAEVAEVARMYAGDDDAEVPVEAIVRSSGGVPAQVHELLDAWVREEASRRLAASAEWLASGRGRHGADIEFANNAIELRLRRIYAPALTTDEVGGECPYMGLAAFGAEQADRFFGRERLVGELAARTVATGLLALVGPSGSGKSSLVSAGLLPSLAAGLLPGSRRWDAVVIRPGTRPMMAFPTDALSRADSERRLVLAVDQFEEVFTLCADETERAVFLEALGEAAADPDRAVVVLSVRGDFLDRIAAYPALAELVSANQVLIAPMRADEYRRAVELPARRYGVRVESALAQALVDEAVDQPGAPTTSP